VDPHRDLLPVTREHVIRRRAMASPFRWPALTCLALVFRAGAVNTDVSSDTREWKERPVAKVVKLLGDMQEELAAEAKTDEETYDKQACWCQTNDATKTKAIADANQLTNELTATIEQHSGLGKKLRMDIATVQKEISKN